MLGNCSLAARVGVAGVLLAAACLGPSPRAASGADDALDQLVAEVEGLAPDVVRARFDEYRRRLLTVRESVERCDRFVIAPGPSMVALSRLRSLAAPLLHRFWFDPLIARLAPARVRGATLATDCVLFPGSVGNGGREFA